MIWGLLYSLAATAGFGALAWLVRRQSIRRGDVVGERLGTVMLASWLVTAVALALTHGHAADAVLIIAPADTGLALMVLVDTRRTRSVRGLWLFGLFGVELFVDGVSAVLGVIGADAYWIVLNIVFSAGVLAAGGPGVWQIIRHGVPDFRPRPEPVRARAPMARPDLAP